MLQKYNDKAELIEILERFGVHGTVAENGLKIIFRQLQFPPSVEALEEIGVVLNDKHGIQKPLLEIVKEVKEACDRLPPIEKDKLLIKVFGIEGGRTFSILMTYAVKAH